MEALIREPEKKPGEFGFPLRRPQEASLGAAPPRYRSPGGDFLFLRPLESEPLDSLGRAGGHSWTSPCLLRPLSCGTAHFPLGRGGGGSSSHSGGQECKIQVPFPSSQAWHSIWQCSSSKLLAEAEQAFIRIKLLNTSLHIEPHLLHGALWLTRCLIIPDSPLLVLHPWEEGRRQGRDGQNYCYYCTELQGLSKHPASLRSGWGGAVPSGSEDHIWRDSTRVLRTGFLPSLLIKLVFKNTRNNFQPY